MFDMIFDFFVYFIFSFVEKIHLLLAFYRNKFRNIITYLLCCNNKIMVWLKKFKLGIFLISFFQIECECSWKKHFYRCNKWYDSKTNLMKTVETEIWLEKTKKGKGSHQKVCFFPDIFSWKCLNISWSSYTENVLKPSEHDACFPFEHTETNLSIFSFKWWYSLQWI